MNTASFNLSDLLRRHEQSKASWLPFLDLPSMSMGIYHVAAGTDDRDQHQPHDRDEVYLGVEGAGRLHAHHEDMEVRAGSLLFVRAGVEHYFHDVTEDLTLLVFFGPREENDASSPE